VQIQQAIEIARRLNLIGPVAEQPEYSMLKREKFEVEFEPLWRNEGYGRYIVLVSMIPRLLMLRPSYSTIFSALAAGFLTGKYNDGLPRDLDTTSILAGTWTSDSSTSTQTRGRSWCRRSGS
jgi:aryl-alcohol dehydrogenase-like predicted oxidoreductase